MSKKTRDEVIDIVLTYMNEFIESNGYLLNNATFNFHVEHKDDEAFLLENKLTLKEIQSAINVCLSRGYIRGHTNYKMLRLTPEGQGRAISIEQTKYKEPVVGSTYHIGILNNNGNAQIGNNNTQQIEQVFNSILRAIDEVDATPDEKDEVKSLLGKFLEHPLTQTAIGTATTVLTSNLGGS